MRESVLASVLLWSGNRESVVLALSASHIVMFMSRPHADLEKQIRKSYLSCILTLLLKLLPIGFRLPGRARLSSA